MQNMFFIFTAVLLLAFSRWIPHPSNFTPVLAMALWLGSRNIPKWASAVVLMASLLLTDWIIGFHNLMPVVYGTLLLTLLGGEFLKTRSQFSKSTFKSNSISWMLSGLFAAVLFFVTTNLGVWWLSGLYPHTSEGLTECFILALPFFQNSLISTWLYSAALLAFSHAFGFSTVTEQNSKI